MTDPCVGVIIVAGGRGIRAGTAVPKQLIDLGGRTVLQRSVAAFDAHPAVSELVVVLPADLLPDYPIVSHRSGGDRKGLRRHPPLPLRGPASSVVLLLNAGVIRGFTAASSTSGHGPNSAFESVL